MFDFISFLEGFVFGIFFVSVFWIGLILYLQDVAEAIRDPKPKVSRNMLGQIKKAQIVTKKDKIDELLGE